ncbi:ATP-dependent helicase [Alkalihalobacillus sp. 1P02AB]|uniref:ATP-dependent helicase n=1 Tax=Alkalihalobacillus sp. 1P02AB TaxID=3132260 RepID=UPI0039A66F3F
MQTAYYHKRVIHLPTIDRSEWQQLYKAGIRGALTCIHCGEKMRLQLSIEEPAQFLHPPTTLSCVDEVNAFEKKYSTQKEEPKKQEQALNGFSIPQNRSISQTRESHDSSWKKPEPLTMIPDFQPTKSTTMTYQSEYRSLLQTNGIYLDDNQWSAVETTEGPLLILAGAGSGKTRVLTTRAAYMLTVKQISPKEMILVTFTAKAAKEMKARMEIYPNLSKQTLKQLMVGTFHSIFYKILLHHHPDRWHSSKLLKMDWQRDKLIKEAGREIDIDEKDFAYDQALTQISWWKNHLISPDQVKAADQWEEKVQYLYKRYEEKRIQEQMFDFDDMLIGCYELLKSDEHLRARYQQRFNYVSIDEFQDINKVQAEIMTMLTGKSNNLCVVGDDDQSIYGFRGSDPDYILSFQQNYQSAKKIILNENYRSNHSIVSVANKVIATNRKRFKKTLKAQHHIENYPTLFYPYDEEEEATIIVNNIKKRIEAGARPADFAILYRTNTHARALFERLIDSSLPFVIESDGESFYNRKTIRKILAYLRLAQNEDDMKAVPDMTSALFLKQNVVQDVKAYSITHDCTLVEAFSYVENLLPFQLKKLKALPKQFQTLKKMTPEKAIQYIESEMGLKDYIKKQGNEGNKMDRGSDDVRDLKVAARQHETISSFLEHVDHMIAKYKEIKSLPPSKEAIQLMTIHRAKGLEYDHVYLLGTVEGNLPHDYALEAWREGNDNPLEEERRLMYVAITRAVQSLSISVPMMRRGKQAQRSRFVREAQKMVSKASSLTT